MVCLPLAQALVGFVQQIHFNNDHHRDQIGDEAVPLKSEAQTAEKIETELRTSVNIREVLDSHEKP